MNINQGRIEKPEFIEFKPKIDDFLKEGLSFQETCMAMEAAYSCSIEGIRLDREGFERLCKKIKDGREG